MQVDKASGGHSGGPFPIQCSPAMRVEDLRILIRVSLGLEGLGGEGGGEAQRRTVQSPSRVCPPCGWRTCASSSE